MKPFFIDFWFQIWITPQNYLIGWLSVAMATVRKIQLHDSMQNVHMYLPTKCEHKSTYGYWISLTPMFSQSEALYGYHGNQMKIMHWFWKGVTRGQGYNVVYDTYL